MATIKLGGGDKSLRVRRKVREIIETAVDIARAPGAPTNGANGGSRTYISPEIEGDNYIDEDGNPVRPFMLGVDALGDPHRPLSVKGRKRRYYG